MTELLEIQARSTTRDLWLKTDFPGAPELGPHRLPDGSDADELVALGAVDGLRFTPRFKRANRGHRSGDLVWTSGAFSKVASPRLIAVLRRRGFTGFKSFDIELTGVTELAGYEGLAITGTQGIDDLWNPGGEPFWSFGITQEVYGALVADGVDGFETTV